MSPASKDKTKSSPPKQSKSPSVLKNKNIQPTIEPDLELEIDPEKPARKVYPFTKNAIETPPALKNTLEKLLFVDTTPLTTLIKTLSHTPTKESLQSLATKINESLKSIPEFNTYTFSHVSFSLTRKGHVGWFESPLYFSPYTLRFDIAQFLQSWDSTKLQGALLGMMRAFIEFQKTLTGDATNDGGIGEQLVIQLIVNGRLGIMYEPFMGGASILEVLFEEYKDSIGHDRTESNCLLWLLSISPLSSIVQDRNVNPKGLSLWFKYYLPLFQGKIMKLDAGILVSACEYLELTSKGLLACCIKERTRDIVGGPIRVDTASICQLVAICFDMTSPQLELIDKKRIVPILNHLIEFLASMKLTLAHKLSTNYFKFDMNLNDVFEMCIKNISKNNNYSSQWCDFATSLLAGPSREHIFATLITIYPSNQKSIIALLKHCESTTLTSDTPPVISWKQISKFGFHKLINTLIKTTRSIPSTPATKNSISILKTIRSLIPKNETRHSIFTIYWTVMYYYTLLCLFFFIIGCPTSDPYDINEFTTFVTCPTEFIPAPFNTIIYTSQITKTTTQTIDKMKQKAYFQTRIYGKMLGLEMDEIEDGVETVVYFVSIKISETMEPVRWVVRYVLETMYSRPLITMVFDGAAKAFNSIVDLAAFLCGVLPIEKVEYWKEVGASFDVKSWFVNLMKSYA